MAKEAKYSLRDLQKDFPDDDTCLDFIFNALHSKECSCGGRYRKLKRRRQYQCSQCRYQIAPTANTIFHKSCTPLTLWFHAIWVFSNAKSGISAAEIERQTGVTQKSAWRIMKQIRKALKQDEVKLTGDIEIDSAYIGGKGRINKKKNVTLSHIMAKKIYINVAIERDGRMKAEVTPTLSSACMEDFIRRNIEPKGATLFTDCSSVYKRTDKTYDRKSVNHSIRYAENGVHVNRVERFFSHLKTSVRGTYKSLSKHHFQSYLDAFVFHYNNRDNDRRRFEVLLDTLVHA